MTLHVSSSPHVFTPVSARNLMLEVLVAMTPAAVAGIVFFGPRAILLICLGAATAVLTEYILQKMARRPVTVGDYSAAVTGLLLALNLPPTAPWWMPVVGSAFAIAVVKQAFGGLGFNFMNPALAARALLVASWPVRMTGDAPCRPFGAPRTRQRRHVAGAHKAGQMAELPRLRPFPGAGAGAWETRRSR